MGWYVRYFIDNADHILYTTNEKTVLAKGGDNMLEYFPSEHELEKLRRSSITKEVKDVLDSEPLKIDNPIPIATREQAEKYINEKVNRYKEYLPYTGNVIAVVDKYISTAMNVLLASGFTYVNLYANTHTFLTEPHIAAALAFNRLNNIGPVPDDIDIRYGLTYT